jgi:hypothetical protein
LGGFVVMGGVVVFVKGLEVFAGEEGHGLVCSLVCVCVVSCVVEVCRMLLYCLTGNFLSCC